MPKASDVRGLPGDIVLIRGGQPIDIWQTPGVMPNARVGVVMPTMTGFIIAVHERAWTYVLWSMPLIIGWVPDGMLRKVKKEL